MRVIIIPSSLARGPCQIDQELSSKSLKVAKAGDTISLSQEDLNTINNSLSKDHSGFNKLEYEVVGRSITDNGTIYLIIKELSFLNRSVKRRYNNKR